jgi:hypothetical protein
MCNPLCTYPPVSALTWGELFHAPEKEVKIQSEMESKEEDIGISVIADK